MSEHVNYLKPMGECQGNQDRCTLAKEGRCPIYGTLLKPTRSDGKQRVRLCGDPQARGKRDRSKGDRKAATARKALGAMGANSRHEEHWGGGLRIEAKAGAQVGPIFTRYQAAKNQSEASRPIGDNRPFVMAAMPDRGPGLLVVEIGELEQIVAALLENWGAVP